MLRIISLVRFGQNISNKSSEFGVRSSEFGVRSSEFGVRSSEFGNQLLVI
ncbi:Cytosine deaminase [Crocosphaera watsonii WH 8502]|uniref:Cytosine deaminase n=1 Tax=Crocosphaera watsonii WH 8502 TaxID=423474 RepID=T2ICV1_CROWT|nr:Cytosine deaminase [Crocosphaera watsonii WH 8502]